MRPVIPNRTNQLTLDLTRMAYQACVRGVRMNVNVLPALVARQVAVAYAITRTRYEHGTLPSRPHRVRIYYC